MFLFCFCASHFPYPFSLLSPFLYDFLKKYALFLKLIRSDTIYFYIFYICFFIFMTYIPEYVLSYNILSQILYNIVKFQVFFCYFLCLDTDLIYPLYTFTVSLLRRFFLTAIISIFNNLCVLALIVFLCHSWQDFT